VQNKQIFVNFPFSEELLSLSKKTKENKREQKKTILFVLLLSGKHM